MSDEERERYRQLSLAALARARELALSISTEKARGNVAGVQAMLPIFESKLRDYVRYGNLSDPERLTDWDEAILGLAGFVEKTKQWILQTGKGIGDSLQIISNPVGLLLAAAVVAWAFGGFRGARR